MCWRTANPWNKPSPLILIVLLKAYTVTHPASVPGKLVHLPLPLFAAPMALGGIGLAWREAGRVIDAPIFVGEAFLALAALIWLLVAVLHVVRTLRHPESMRADLRHPVRSAFVGAVTIGLMLIAGGLIPHAPEAAKVLWSVAVVAHVIIGVWTVRGLLASPRDAATLTPPLLIPLVGNILAPIFGAKLGFIEVSWGLFGIGFLLWAMIQPLLLWRIVVGPALPERLKPTLVIFLAPPAVGSIALANLTQGFGPGPLVAFGLAVFIALVLVVMVRDFARVPFAMSWWGWTFPTAAFTIASLSAAHAHPAEWQHPVLWGLLLTATAILALVSVATLRAAFTGSLFKPE